MNDSAKNDGLAIEFPALWFSQNLVQSIDSLDEVSCCSRLALKGGFYKGLMLIDSQGRQFEVTDARKIRTLPPQPTFGSILGYVTGNARLRVELMFASRPPREVPLEAVKKCIFDSFRKEKYSWEAMIDFDDFNEKIMAAITLEQILLIFKEYHV